MARSCTACNGAGYADRFALALWPFGEVVIRTRCRQCRGSGKKGGVETVTFDPPTRLASDVAMVEPAGEWAAMYVEIGGEAGTA